MIERKLAREKIKDIERQVKRLDEKYADIIIPSAIFSYQKKKPKLLKVAIFISLVFLMGGTLFVGYAYIQKYFFLESEQENYIYMIHSSNLDEGLIFRVDFTIEGFESEASKSSDVEKFFFDHSNYYIHLLILDSKEENPFINVDDSIISYKKIFLKDPVFLIEKKDRILAIVEYQKNWLLIESNLQKNQFIPIIEEILKNL